MAETPRASEEGVSSPAIVNPRAEAVRWLRELADDLERGDRLIEHVDVERHYDNERRYEHGRFKGVDFVGERANLRIEYARRR